MTATLGILGSAVPQLTFADPSARAAPSLANTALNQISAELSGAQASPSTSRTLAIMTARDHAMSHLNGEEPTTLLQEMHRRMREELNKAGDKKDYTDLELSKMIVAE